MEAHRVLENGNVTLNQEELNELAQLPKSVERRAITIRNNITRDQALQINAPIGSDLWKNLSKLDIFENVAEGNSRQFNYAQNMDVYRNQMAMIPRPLDFRFFAVLIAAVAALYIIYSN